MVITYYGTSCFKVQSGETVIAFDPPSKKSGLRAPRFESHITLISHDHDKHNGRDVLNAKSGEELFVVDGPGEYEKKGIYINGIHSYHDKDSGKKYGSNTIYILKLEGINICHLGDFGEKELRDELKQEMGGVDVLFVPIGGDTVLDAEMAASIINKINPSIVVPMHFDSKSKKSAGKSKGHLDIFLEEMGHEKMTPEDKLTIKKKDIIEEKTRIVVLNSSI